MNNDRFLHNEPEVKFALSLGLIMIALFLTSYVIEKQIKRENISVPSKVASAFDSVDLEAKAAYVYDVRTKTVLFAKNADTRLPLASLTKVMGGVVALEIAPAYSTVIINSDALRAEGESGLLAGEKWSLENLLDFTLTSSSNDGIEAIALALGSLKSSTPTYDEVENDFVRQMNEKADELGMKNTYYWNVTGLDESGVKGGAYGSARDMVILFDYVLHNEPRLLEMTREPSFNAVSFSTVHTARNTNSIAGLIPGLKASKTGFTDIAGGNLVVAFDPEVGRPIIVAVLGSSAQARFKDVEALIRATLEEIKNR